MWGAIKKAINSNLNKSLDVLIQEKVTETNGKVDSKASQASINSLDTKLEVLQQLNYGVSKNIRAILLTRTVGTKVRIQMPIGVKVLCFASEIAEGIGIQGPIINSDSTNIFEVKINGKVVTSIRNSSAAFNVFSNLCDTNNFSKSNSASINSIFDSETYFDTILNNVVKGFYVYVCDK